MANSIKQGDILRLEVSPKYAGITVLPNGDEGNDKNFPTNLYSVAELFLRLGMVPNAVNLKTATDKLLEMYEGPPKDSITMGQASVCFKCGHVGIGKNFDESRKTPGPCANCNETNQINWVMIKRPDGSVLPWMEASAMSTEQETKLKEKEKEDLADRRAAVEARVAAALKERDNTKVVKG
ncbi:unnamed protein product [Cylindrotheca closterium]|uniref:Uncharacterized protein n=1 Tax=Cylindrotheca closterium TaxID=2856 RepID=A0AAD2CKM8_9STRA|nr:unnamed protein product [Cylindrotheca closterium]